MGEAGLLQRAVLYDDCGRRGVSVVPRSGNEVMTMELEERPIVVVPGPYYAVRCTGWSYGDHANGAPVDPGEILDVRPHSTLVGNRNLLPVPSGTVPVRCDCGRRFVSDDALRVHRHRTPHGERR
jgi:hypothetical protein